MSVSNGHRMPEQLVDGHVARIDTPTQLRRHLETDHDQTFHMAPTVGGLAFTHYREHGRRGPHREGFPDTTAVVAS